MSVIASLPPIPASAHEMARESNHRIANNLALVSSLLRMKSNAIAKRGAPLDAKEVAELLTEVAVRVDGVAKIHRLLSACEGQASVAAGPYLSEICTSVASSIGGAHSVAFDDESGDLAMPAERLNALGLFLAECLTNSIKHAHPAGVPGQVSVRLQHGDEGAVHLAIQDDGVGLPVGFDPNRDGGLGMRIMRSLSAQLGGSMQVRATDLGVRVGLRLPQPATDGAPAEAALQA